MVEKQTEQNAYLNSFQVSRVWETEAHTTESGETSPREDEKEKEADEEKFWNSLLQQRYPLRIVISCLFCFDTNRIQQAAQEEQDKLGKGKRKRMPIKYDVDKDASSVCFPDNLHKYSFAHFSALLKIHESSRHNFLS